MTPEQPSKPTEAEFQILTTIWDLGRATVREVHEALAPKQDVGLTTVLKLMQIMVQKGLLERDTSVRPQVFRAARPRKQTQRQLVRDLLDTAFGGSAANLALQALSLRRASPEELSRVRELLDELEERDA